MLNTPKIKRLENIPEKVYHGSTTAHQDSLKKVRVDVSRIDLDFGRGFYTTSVKEQAIEWAIGKSNKKHKPLLLTYKINLDIIKLLNGKIFGFPNDEWAKVIYDNRLETRNRLIEYDYIYGHLADGIMVSLIADINNGIKTFSEFKKEIIPRECKIFYYDQLVFKTARSIGVLEKIEEEVL